MGQRIGYIRPEGGQMLDATGLWQGAKTMQFSPQEVVERLSSVA